MIFRSCVAFLLLTTWTSCQLGVGKTGDSIDPELKRQIEGQHEALFTAIRGGDLPEFRKQCSARFLRSAGELTSFMEEFSSLPLVDPDAEVITAHFQQLVPDQVNQVNYQGATISYTSDRSESYLSIYPFQTGDGNLMLWATNFGRDEEGNWKLDFLRYGMLRVAGKDAMQYYGQSIDHLLAGHLIDAALQADMLAVLYQPIPELWRYRAHLPMEQHIQKIRDTIDQLYSLPIDLEMVPSQPQLLAVYLDNVRGQVLPFVRYQTTTAIEQTALIRTEIARVHEAVGELFPGFVENNAKIGYVAYGGNPEAADTPYHLYFMEQEAAPLE